MMSRPTLIVASLAIILASTLLVPALLGGSMAQQDRVRVVFPVVDNIEVRITPATGDWRTYFFWNLTVINESATPATDYKVRLILITNDGGVLTEYQYTMKRTTGEIPNYLMNWTIGEQYTFNRKNMDPTVDSNSFRFEVYDNYTNDKVYLRKKTSEYDGPEVKYLVLSTTLIIVIASVIALVILVVLILVIRSILKSRSRKQKEAEDAQRMAALEQGQQNPREMKVVHEHIIHTDGDVPATGPPGYDASGQPFISMENAGVAADSVDYGAPPPPDDSPPPPDDQEPSASEGYFPPPPQAGLPRTVSMSASAYPPPPGSDTGMEEKQPDQTTALQGSFPHVAAVCPLCNGVVKDNVPAYICGCATIYHSSCSERSPACPKCGLPMAEGLDSLPPPPGQPGQPGTAEQPAQGMPPPPNQPAAHEGLKVMLPGGGDTEEGKKKPSGRCFICRGLIKAGLESIDCKCSKNFHKACADRLGECPNCGRKI